MLRCRILKRSSPIVSAFCACLVMAFCANPAVAQAPGTATATAPDTEVKSPTATLPDAATSGAKTATDANLPIAATVAGTPIYQRDVEAAQGESAKQKYEPAALKNIQASILEQLITKTLLEKYLAGQKMTANKDDVDAAIDRLKATLKQQNTTFEAFLSRMHLTEAGLRDTVSRELAWRKYVSANETDDNLRALFKVLHEQFDGTERRVSHILLRPEAGADPEKLAALREQALKLRDDITSGRISFEAAAEKYSAGPSRHQQGDLGYIPAQGVMTPEFSQAAFALQPGEISQPVLTPFGFHLIKVTDIKPGKKSFEDVRDAVKARFPDLLFRQVTALLRQKYADKIEYNENFPHFKSGTTELANPQAVDGSP